MVTWNIHHHHQSLNQECCWGITDDLAISCINLCLSFVVLCVSESRPVYSLMLSSHLFLCLPLLAPLTVPCRMVFVRPDVRETCPYHFSFRLFTVRRSCRTRWLVGFCCRLLLWLHGLCMTCKGSFDST